MLETLRQDVRLALRGFLRDRGVTLLALASLSVGIAANGTIFSLVYALQFPQLIYPAASRIVFLETDNLARNLQGMPASAPDAADVARTATTLEHASLTADQSSMLTTTGTSGDNRTRVSGRRVSASFFDVMQVPASAGRVLLADDAPGVMVLSDRVWRAQFGADPSIVGTSVRLDGGTVRVVGLMPAKFDVDADFWTPIDASVGAARRDDRQYTMFARLAPTRSIRDAERELQVISTRLAADHPATNRDWRLVPVLMTRLHGRDSHGVFFMLQGAVGFVLLIACANIANLQLARGTRRAREMALRLSLGATRRRLIRQLLTESMLLATAGGAVGVLLSMWGIQFARTVGGFPAVINPQLNIPVVTFTAVLSMATGVLTGLLPALRASNTAPESAMRADSSRTGTGARGRLRGALVALQIASAVVLVVCAALMMQTFANRQRVDLGFNPGGALRASLFIGTGRDAAGIRSATGTLVTALEANPAVAAAGVSTFALPTGAGAQRVITRLQDGESPVINRGGGVEAVTPKYFAAMEMPLRSGRVFTGADTIGTDAVAVINDKLAAALWRDASPIGHTLRLGAIDDPAAPVVTVVGVVGSIRRSAMHDTIARAYLPFAQYPNGSLTLTVRGRGDTAAATRAIGAAAGAVDPALMAENVTTLQADTAAFVAPVRMMTLLLGSFGAIGLFLAGLGVFGTMSYTISQRERELAVRTALGASHADILRLVFGSAAAMTAAGVIPGVIAALLAARALRSLLFGVTTTDPLTFTGVAVFLVVVSLLACYRPARTATSIDPIQILRRD